MQLAVLIDALRRFDALAARQWVADAMNSSFEWSAVSRPEGMDGEGLAIAAGIVELLAQRSKQRSPGWTADVAESPRKIFLVKAAETMPRLRRLCEEEGPEPLRRRRILAPPEFLTVA